MNDAIRVLEEADAYEEEEILPEIYCTKRKGVSFWETRENSCP